MLPHSRRKLFANRTYSYWNEPEGRSLRGRHEGRVHLLYSQSARKLNQCAE